ncbi:MAG: hypothetical protein M9921_12980 [Fimbriimonadaceae bacterium]|nr:hypothetical protein [Fimbriimonadaceae bacterium]
MKTAGRVSPLLILGVASILVLAFLLMQSSSTPSGVAAEFMTALGKGDVDELMRVSYAPGRDEAEMRKEWEFAVNVAGLHYRFAYRILNSKQADDKNASVSLHVFRNADLDSTYGEKYEIPMVKVGDEWKVDAFGLNREMYPGLPR